MVFWYDSQSKAYIHSFSNSLASVIISSTTKLANTTCVQLACSSWCHHKPYFEANCLAGWLTESINSPCPFDALGTLRAPLVSLSRNTPDWRHVLSVVMMLSSSALTPSQ